MTLHMQLRKVHCLVMIISIIKTGKINIQAKIMLDFRCLIYFLFYVYYFLHLKIKTYLLNWYNFVCNNVIFSSFF